MVSTFDNRVDGISTSTALKVPCRVATTAEITLSGLQTIDGVTVVAGDRVLVKDQTDTTKNGIYVASATTWQRAEDFNGNRDVVTGTRVYIVAGTTLAGYEATVTTANPIVIGTSAIAFSLLDGADASQAIRWQFDDATAMADPGSGLIRFNNATVASVTAIAIDDTSINSGDVSAYVATWDDSTSTVKGTLTIRKGGAFGVYAIFSVTGLTDNAGWSQVTVAHISSAGSFSDGDDIFVSFVSSGSIGDGDVTGPASATNNALVQFDGTTGKAIKNGPTLGEGANQVLQLDANANAYVAMAIGVPFPVMDHITGVVAPSNSGTAKFIKLTAGLTGSGQYNEGLLANESTSGTAPLVVATADINTGPLNGQEIHLWNTEGRYIKPGTTAGTTANDQMQQITGSIGNASTNGHEGGITAGAFSDGAATSAKPSYGTAGGVIYEFDSANSPNARTGTSTDVKHEQITYYMRIV
jgi:hypothetical protein